MPPTALDEIFVFNFPDTPSPLKSTVRLLYDLDGDRSTYELEIIINAPIKMVDETERIRPRALECLEYDEDFYPYFAKGMLRYGDNALGGDFKVLEVRINRGIGIQQDKLFNYGDWKVPDKNPELKK